MNENTIKPTSLRLTHFSNKPLKLQSVKCSALESELRALQGTVYGKPIGLWLSDESDFGWREWCKSAKFHLKNLTYQTVFDVSLEKILLLQNTEELLAFTEKYASEDLKLPSYFNLPKFKMAGIAWDRVQKDFAGIVITPYQWRCRLELSWYYGWDCASGCIWDFKSLSEIHSFKTSEENVMERL